MHCPAPLRLCASIVFYPFVAGELKQAEPGIFALLREVWGPLPERAIYR
jgi:hypothetical protein